VAQVIAAWRPRAFAPVCAELARTVVGDCAPTSLARARTLLWSVAALARFADSVAMELRPELVLHPATIERFIVVGCAQAPRGGGARYAPTCVSSPGGSCELCAPAPAALARSRAKAPYAPEEIAAFFALADAQPSLARRMRLTALVCLGAGAGLTGADLRHVRGLDCAFRRIRTPSPGFSYTPIGGGVAADAGRGLSPDAHLLCFIG